MKKRKCNGIVFNLNDRVHKTQLHIHDACLQSGLSVRLSGATTGHSWGCCTCDKPPCLLFTCDDGCSGFWKIARRCLKHAWSFQLKPSRSLVDVQLFSEKAHWLLSTEHWLRGGTDACEYFYGLLDLVYPDGIFMPIGKCLFMASLELWMAF